MLVKPGGSWQFAGALWTSSGAVRCHEDQLATRAETQCRRHTGDRGSKANAAVGDPRGGVPVCARNNVERLADDHANAEHLAEGLARIAPVKALSHATNMVFARFPEADRAPLEAWLKARGILTQMLYASRFVTHCDVSREDIDTFVDAVGAYFAQQRG
jgi:threonine aldolase